MIRFAFFFGLLVLVGCAGGAAIQHTSAVLRPIVQTAGDRALRQERLLTEIREADAELGDLAIRFGRRGVGGGVEVRVYGLPKRLPTYAVGRALEIQGRLDALLMQYAIQYGSGTAWCEDPVRGRLTFRGLPRYEDLNLRVQCVVADAGYPGGRRVVTPMVTFDAIERAAASQLVSGQYETSRYPLPAIVHVAGPARRPLVCHLAGE